jgi:hypothetical protein
MVKVTVAVYVPVAYTGSLVRVHATDPLLPALADLASAPKVPTDVLADMLAVCAPLQAVPGAVTVQVYASASPVDGGVATEGPPPAVKSAVTLSVMLPVPPVFEVRTRYRKLVTPAKSAAKPPEAAARVLVPVVTVRAASGPTTTDRVVVFCAFAKLARTSKALTAKSLVAFRDILVFVSPKWR